MLRIKAFGRWFCRIRVYMDWGAYMFGPLDMIVSNIGMFFGFVTMDNAYYGVLYGIGGYLILKAAQILFGFSKAGIKAREYHAEFSSRMNPVQVRIHNALTHGRHKLEVVK